MPPPTPPIIDVRTLPEEDHERAIFVQTLLGDLGSRCEDLRAAVALYDLVDAMEFSPKTHWDAMALTHRWAFIAARDAASTIYKTYEDIGALGENINRCASVRGLIDHKKKREATKLFQKHFPHFEGVRHAAHHTLFGTPEAQARHIGDAIPVVNNLFGRRFQTSFQGKQIAFEISEDSVSKLIEVRDTYWMAFENLNVMPRPSGAFTEFRG